MSRAIILAIVGIAVASAASAQVVALGASGTKGYMLPEAETWPAKLQALLHARGLDVSVSNQGINGDTSDGMRARLEIGRAAGHARGDFRPVRQRQQERAHDRARSPRKHQSDYQ